MTRDRRPVQVVRAVAALAAAGALVLAPASEAAAPVAALAAAGPQATTAGFATPQVVATLGQPVSFFNGDITNHTVTSRATKTLKVKVGKKIRTVKVPLFDTGAAAALATKDVKGVKGLKAGTYDFLCALHPGMKGQLVVLPVATP